MKIALVIVVILFVVLPLISILGLYVVSKTPAVQALAKQRQNAAIDSAVVSGRQKINAFLGV